MNFFTAITARVRGGHKFLAHEYTEKYLKDNWRNSDKKPTIPLLRMEMDECRPSEDDLRDLLFTKRPPQKIPNAGNKKMAQYHIFWFLIPFIRKEEAKDLADLMRLMEKCMLSNDELRGIVAWWKRRKG